MIYFNAFIFCGIICLIGQIILDNTKLTPGHITAMFVVLGAFLDVFGIYDKFILWAGGRACVPITSFGHLLIHGAMAMTMLCLRGGSGAFFWPPACGRVASG